MESRTIDVIAALLTVPLMYEFFSRTHEGDYGEHEYQMVVDSYFQLRKVFERTYYDVGRPA